MANPPVCRIMDYGKFKFDEAQRAKETRRKAVHVGIKEMKYRPKIGPGDFDTKTRQVAKFLDEGHKVKITIMFRGREVFHPELGKRILDRIAEQMEGVGQGRGRAQARRPQHGHGARPRQAGPPGRGQSREPVEASSAPTKSRLTDADRREPSCRTRRTVRRRPPWSGRRATTPHRPKRDDDMPKMKTDRGAAKRIKVTGTGRLRRRKAFRSHILEKKSSVRTRRLGQETDVAKADERAVRRHARHLSTDARPPRTAGTPDRPTATMIRQKGAPPWPE